MSKAPKLVPSMSEAAKPRPIDVQDLQNLVSAARLALPQLDSVSLGYVATSIARIEAVISQSKPTATDGTNKAP